MKLRFSLPIAAFSLLPFIAQAAAVQGSVVDPSGAAMPGVRVAAVNRVGVVRETTTDTAGVFRLELPGDFRGRLLVLAAGFETRRVNVEESAEPLRIVMPLAPQTDSLTVTGSAFEAPLSEQGSSITVIPREEIERRNEALVLDLIREAAGVVVNQTGPRGGLASLHVRGGNADYNLVLVDGVPVNSFGIGNFDFAHIPSERLERVELIRGAQSAVYGSYANSSVVNFVTRLGDEVPRMDITAEGGTFATRRFSIGSGGTFKGFQLSAFASQLNTDGPTANSDYRNQNLSLTLRRHFQRQSVTLGGAFISSGNGVPGPYGSDPAGLFPGLDLISRNNNSFSTYHARYEADLNGRLRQELFGSYFQNNNKFDSPWGPTFNKDVRGTGEARTLVSLTESDTLAFGFSFSREQVTNSSILDGAMAAFPLHRDHEGVYAENRFRYGSHLILTAGLRADFIQTPRIPANPGFGRPEFPAHTLRRVNPKVAAGYVLGATRLHASFGTGIRPPNGFDLAFTDNPALKTERTRSFDAGIEQRLFGHRLALDATYFYNRYYDLIVSLGGSLARLSAFKTDNLSNSRAAGVELSARLRPHSAVTLAGNYTWLDSEILSLNGASGVAQHYFQVGQWLVRRPRHSGAVTSTFTYKRMSANLIGYFRGETLDTEPNYGASAGLFRNPGYASAGINLNLDAGHGLTLYGNLRNALNQRYEEIFGFPSPRLNFVTGIKWRASGRTR
ncbi:MAG: TonB-dependent receptor [Bryobacterales bacterium]|nr:TonB-dependent receptor [Bryobacterales bacterium]